jgi:asparagine synthase (glutamine-hydrolysing)
MCGIAAIYNHDFRAGRVDTEELTRIRDHMASRGPDGAGMWISAGGRAALAHRRLSIIDLSERGSQPMSILDGAYTITFNGEIYNYKELRKQLEDDGVRFASDSDTEVVLHLYAEKGAAMVRDLRGMFAFAIWDDRRKGMLLGRDPYGIKPLYYSDQRGTVRVASQVRAITAGGNVPKTVDNAGLAGFYLHGSVPEPLTIFKSIRALPAGHTMWIDDEGVQRPHMYFSLASVFHEAELAARDMSREEAYALAADALLESVRYHMIADVPVGLFLSAGIDSTSLTGLALDAGIHDPRTITLAFEEFKGERRDEAPLAEKVARHYATNHTMRLLTAGEFRADIPRIFASMDQPSIDGINTYFVSKAAASTGLKVALSGLGGDELFAGYNTFIDVPAWVRRFRIPSRIPFAGELFRTVHENLLSNSGHSPKRAGALLYGGSFEGAYFLRRGMFLPSELPIVMHPDDAAEGLAEYDPLESAKSLLEDGPAGDYARVAVLEASMYMRNQLLRDSDWASMAHSLEVRVPYVDAWLTRRVAPMLVRNAMAERKKLIALAPSRPLPGEILKRPKTGFFVPIQNWLETDPGLQEWKSNPVLAREGCAWERRWSAVVASELLSS